MKLSLIITSSIQTSMKLGLLFDDGASVRSS